MSFRELHKHQPASTGIQATSLTNPVYHNYFNQIRIYMRQHVTSYVADSTKGRLTWIHVLRRSADDSSGQAHH